MLEQGKQEIVPAETHGPRMHELSISPSPVPEIEYMSRDDWMTGAAHVWDVLDSAARALEALDGCRQDEGSWS